MRKALLSAIIAASVAGAASADIYNDTAGDVFTGAGGGILDILSLEVTNDATSISFRFTLAGDVEATDWGKYMVIIDSSNSPGGDPAGNGWNRPIGFAGPNGGADYWIGSWVDSGNGAELYSWGGASWGLNEATYNAPPNNDISISKSGSTVTITTLLANLGVDVGDKIFFDAYSSGGGGGDGAIDALANPGLTVGDWGQPYNSGQLFFSYTIVPAPATLTLLGVGGLIAGRRRR